MDPVAFRSVAPSYQLDAPASGALKTVQKPTRQLVELVSRFDSAVALTSVLVVRRTGSAKGS